MPSFPRDPESITAAWLGDVLKTDVRSCELERIAVGIGLLGRLFRVHLRGGPDLPQTVVVKLPTLDSRARTMICEDLEFYLREVRFYEDVGHSNPLTPARAYYAAFDEETHDFVLVLEDLSRLRLADQTAGCSIEDAETVIDAIASHHAHWWDNDRLASLPWLKSYTAPPFLSVLIGTYEAAWPRFLEGVGSEISPALRDFGLRFTSLIPWLANELSRPPHTFLHGDLRLDQLFFAVDADDPAVTALDWQIAGKGRGAYDVGYFLSQSLTADTRRRCEDRLLDRYAERLAGHDIDYPAAELRRDYRLTATWCFAYPVVGAGGIDVANDRQVELLRIMLAGATAAIEDHDGMSLRPD